MAETSFDAVAGSLNDKLQNLVISGSFTTTTDSQGRITAPVSIANKCLRFYSDVNIVQQYRIDGGDPTRTLIWLLQNNGSPITAPTTVTVKWDYLSL